MFVFVAAEWRKTMSTLERTKSGILQILGFLIPLVQSIPPLGIWTGLMTVPLIGYLVMMFATLPASFPEALIKLFFGGRPLEQAVAAFGLLTLAYSVAYLAIKKEAGLVTTGPYRLVRHPQYLGMVLLTLGFTSRSYWILTNTFGIGFLSPVGTVCVWLIELFAYVLLASIEESYLSKSFGIDFENYRSKVPFLIPWLNTNAKTVEIAFSILIPSLLLLGLIVAYQ